jgi:lipopolysaccharide transport system ATP-binding protein
VLAVGDAAFQKKCLGKMEEVAEHGRTIVFVSHNMAAITRFCSRCIWVDSGTVRADGQTEEVVAAYLASGVQESGEAVFPDEERGGAGSEFVRLLAVRVRDEGGRVTASIDARRAFTLEVEYRILRRSSGLRVGVAILTTEGTALISSTDGDAGEDDRVREPGRYVSRCTVPGQFLNYGQYFVSAGADFPMIQTHFHRDRLLSFFVERTGGVGGHIPDARSGLLRMHLPWQVSEAS